MRKIRQPIPNEVVFICGEAYSNHHGWVEDALQTAEHVLRDGIGLDVAGWLHNAVIGPQKREEGV